MLSTILVGFLSRTDFHAGGLEPESEMESETIDPFPLRSPQPLNGPSS